MAVGSRGSSRSKVNIAMISALNRPHELTLHITSAFNTGVTRDQIMEILLQVACCAGVPAGIDSFCVAREALSREGEREVAGRARLSAFCPAENIG